MPRTLDEIIEAQGAYAQTPIPPVATYSTPGWGPTMGSLQTPSQAELIRQATPTLAPPMMSLSQMNAHNMALAMGSTPQGYSVAPPPPPPSPMTQIMAAHAAQYSNPAAVSMGAGLGASQAYLDPRNALQAMGQRKAQQFGQGVGSAFETAGNIMGFVPGMQAAGLGLSLGGDWLGQQVAKIPGVEAFNRQLYGSAAQDVSTMAQLQHGTAGMMNLTGSSSGLGGTGMSASGALQLGQQYRRQATSWAQQNPTLAKQVGGGDTDAGMQRYTQDLTKLTQMAGESGLLDAATNIDQIGSTVSKLFKVLGTMGKITGDPDFKNNLREIANMKQMGLTMDQAVNATRDMQRYARGAGVTREEMMATGGVMGQQAFSQAGMAGGVGMVYGAQAQMQARQLSGAFSPIQESLLGGREGISQRWAMQQANFAAGPMNLMMGAAMSAGEGGIGLDAGKMSQMFKGGMSLPGMIGQSQGNLMKVARQMAQQQGRSVQDVMGELQAMQPELQSEMAQRLGPEGMRMLQMQTISALSRPSSEGGMGMGLHTAAQLVANKDPQQAKLLTGMMTSPEFYERERDRLGQRLADMRVEAKQERLSESAEREKMRGFFGMGKDAAVRRGVRSIGEGLSTFGHFISAGDSRAAANAKEAEETARSMAEQEDAARGISRVHLGRALQGNTSIIEEGTARLKKEEGLDLSVGSGVGKFERLRRMQERGYKSDILKGITAGASIEQIEQALDAEGKGTNITRFAQSTAFSVARAGASAMSYLTDNPINERTVGPTGGTRRTIDETLEMAQAIEETQNAGFTDLTKAMRRDEKLLTEAGAKSGAIFAMKKTMLAYAERVGTGQEGKVLKSEAIRKHLRATLKAQGLPEKEINKILADKNMDHWKKMTIGMAKEFGTKEAKAAISETTAVADKFFDGATKDMQERFDTFQTEYEDELEKAGVTTDKFWTDAIGTEEQTGLEAVQGAENAVEREAMVLMGVLAGGKDDGITDAMKKEASEKLDKLSLSDDKTYEKAKKKMEALQEKGGDIAVKTVGKLAKIEQKYTGGLANLQQELEKGYTTGKGRYALPGKASMAASEVEALGGTIKDGKIELPTESGVGTSKAGEMKVIEGQIANLSEMKKQFAGFGKSAKTLQIAADAQLKAAAMMTGRKVAEVVAEFNKENKSN